MSSRAAVLLAVFCTLSPTGLAAQDTLVRTTIDSGTLIRMHPAAGASIRGRLTQPLGPSTTLVQFCRYPVPSCATGSDSSAYQRIPTASLVRVEVQQGSRWATGALIGGSIGGLLGGLLGAVANGMCEDANGCGTPTIVYALIGAAGFGGFGALIGTGSPRWRPAP
jgi:hypothetical protein